MWLACVLGGQMLKGISCAAFLDITSSLYPVASFSPIFQRSQLSPRASKKAKTKQKIDRQSESMGGIQEVPTFQSNYHTCFSVLKASMATQNLVQNYITTL